jgi:hypothetical protein
MLGLQNPYPALHAWTMFVAFLFVIPQALLSQPKVKFQQFTVEDGLSQDYIFCMIQVITVPGAYPLN